MIIKGTWTKGSPAWPITNASRSCSKVWADSFLSFSSRRSKITQIRELGQSYGTHMRKAMKERQWANAKKASREKGNGAEIRWERKVVLLVMLPPHWLSVTSSDFWENVICAYDMPSPLLHLSWFALLSKRSLDSIQVPYFTKPLTVSDATEHLSPSTSLRRKDRYAHLGLSMVQRSLCAYMCQDHLLPGPNKLLAL